MNIEQGATIVDLRFSTTSQMTRTPIRSYIVINKRFKRLEDEFEEQLKNGN